MTDVLLKHLCGYHIADMLSRIHSGAVIFGHRQTYETEHIAIDLLHNGV